MSYQDMFLAFGFGIAFAAPPGIVTAEAIRRGFSSGFWSAAMVGLGSLTGDAAYAILAFAGLAQLVQYETAKLALGIIGSSVLLFLAYSAFRTESNLDYAASGSRLRNAFAVGAVLSFTNPWAIAFWIGFGGVFLGAGIEHHEQHLVLLLSSFLAGSTAWVFILAGLIAFGRKFLNPFLFRAISLVSALVFLVTALYVLFEIFKPVSS